MSDNTCPGRLVVHDDGSAALCTEQLDGRRCSGYNEAMHAGVIPCHAMLEEIPCSYCESLAGNDRLPRPVLTDQAHT